MRDDDCGVNLYWLPLGAGGVFVRWNGRVYERLLALREHRRPQPLFHCAAEVRLHSTRYVIEMAPVWSLHAPDRGVVVEGPVGARWLGRSRAFRYEVRCWRDGRIPDLAEAVDSPVAISADADVANRILTTVQAVPPLIWGRDELRAGDMWNSNSLIAWLLCNAGMDASAMRPPHGGRAPGWHAGIVLADQQRR